MTIKEIAAIAEVSISTVSKIINGKDDSINPQTRERVLRVVKEYNYTPYAAIKNQAAGKSFMLGLLLKNADSSCPLVAGILGCARENGYSVLLCESGGDSETELKQISMLCQKHVDGVIWEPASGESRTPEKYFTEAGVQTLCINSPREGSCRIPFQEMGYRAAAKLAALGHTKIGCLTGGDPVRAREIADGFRQCLYERSVPYSEDMLLAPDADPIRLQSILHRFTGILSADYDAAVRLYGNLSGLKVQIPCELSILSFTERRRDPEYPKISSIPIPLREFGAHVCQKIIARCEGQSLDEADFRPSCEIRNAGSLDVPRTAKKPRIVVVGSINMDTILNVEKVPHIGETVSTTICSTYAGGKGANQAVGAAKLGHKVSLIGKIGDDADGAYICGCMREYGIDISGTIRDSENVTGKAYIHVQNGGDSTISICSGANSAICGPDIAGMEDLFENSGFCLMQTEIPLSAVYQASVLARKHGVPTILKPSACKFLDDRLIANIDILAPNRMEMNTICPLKGTLAQQADYFLSRGVKTVIITLGQNGCYMKSADAEQSFPAADFAAIDNTGASDAFISALASYLLYGYPMEKAIRIATCAAGFSVSRQGVIPALVDKNSLEVYISGVDPAILASGEQA